MKAIFLTLLLEVFLSAHRFSDTTFTSVPFQIVQNLIVVQASVNGKNGHFILDTGVSDIILNKRHFDGRPTGEKFYGVSGNEIDKENKFIRFGLGGFKRNVLAIVTDFTALEQISGLNIFGVIGNRLFRNSELVLDYTFKELTIYPLNKNGHRLSSKEIHEKPLDTVPLLVSRGVPFIEVIVNGKRLKMSLDSGASVNLIDGDEFDRLNSGLGSNTKNSLASFGHNRISANALNIHNLEVGNLICPPMKTLFVQLDHLNQNQWGMSVDGILGYEFLSNFRVAINFRKREVHLWDRDSVELQWLLAKNNLTQPLPPRPPFFY